MNRLKTADSASAAARRQFNRTIIHGQNRIWTGDVPLFRMDTSLGVNCYTQTDRVFSLGRGPTRRWAT